MSKISDTIGRLLLAAFFLVNAGFVAAQEKSPSGKPATIELGKYKIMAPADWRAKEPSSRILAYEFAAPAKDGDTIDGRLTVMSAGGSVADNIDRWYGQFKQPDGSSSKDKAKVEKKTIAGQEVHLVDIAGTYIDKPGPFAPGVDREKFRMLAAIVVTEQGNFFVKFYGPQKTMAQYEKSFKTMIEGLTTK